LQAGGPASACAAVRQGIGQVDDPVERIVVFERAIDRALDDFLTRTGDRAVDLRLRLFRVLTKDFADRSNT